MYSEAGVNGNPQEVVDISQGQIDPSCFSDDQAFRFTLLVPAGGWYCLEITGRDADSDETLKGSVERFGVGEVFVVAGQSYATNTNEQLLEVRDPRQRVVAFDAPRGTWSPANDPQPTPDGSDGGSIWPSVGDRLVGELQVPIAFANVAYGGTSSAQWLPEGWLCMSICVASAKAWGDSGQYSGNRENPTLLPTRRWKPTLPTFNASSIPPQRPGVLNPCGC